MDGLIESNQYLFRNVSITISILLILTYAISRVAFPKMFAAIYDFSKFLSFRIKDEFGSNIRFLSTENLYFTAILSASASFVVLSFLMYQPETSSTFSFLIPESFGAGLLIWLLLTLAIQLIFLLKYLFIALIGYLFNLPTSFSRHYQEVQSLNNCFMLAALVTFTLAIYSSHNFPTGLLNVMITVTVIYLLYRLLNIYIKLEHLKAYSKLYIFSYLCTTEIVPTIIGLELLS